MGFLSLVVICDRFSINLTHTPFCNSLGKFVNQNSPLMSGGSQLGIFRAPRTRNTYEENPFYLPEFLGRVNVNKE